MRIVESTLMAAWPDWLNYFSQFDTYFILFAATAAAAALTTPVYILFAKRFGWVDPPGELKRQGRSTATMGGLVVFAVVFVGVWVTMRLDNLVGGKLRANRLDIYVLMACTTSMILLGIIDDRHAIRPRFKLMVQILVAIAAVSLGYRMSALTLPWLGSVVLPPGVSVGLSLIWIIGITNAINLTDGLDGLAVGVCLLASAVNAIVAIWLGNYYMTVMMVLLAGALSGFLRYNFHPARVFLGDTGSLALGMYLALASLHSAQKAHTAVLILVPLFALGYPIFDTLLAIARRMFRGQPLFARDRDHIHHRLLDRGRSPSAAAIQIYIASLVISLLCIAAATANHFALGLGMAGVGLMALFSARVLGYLEWGGWMARWSGREETKVLHAAAHLARLKLHQAQDQMQMIEALSVAAREMGCLRITLIRGEQSAQWTDPHYPDIATDFSDEEGTNATSVVDIPLAEETTIQFQMGSPATLDDERAQILEELCTDLAGRLG